MRTTQLTQLVKQAAKGDAEAFSRLLARYRGFVYAICLSQVRQAAEAEDLTQEVFVRVYQDLADLRDPQKFLPWLRQVTRNVCRMWFRQQRPASPLLETIAEQDDAATAARLRRSELGEIISVTLTQLSRKNREVLALHYLVGCSEAEIAASLGLSRATIKSRLHEGRQQAKRKLLPSVKELLSLQAPSKEMVDRIMQRCNSPGCICPDTLMEGR